MATPRLSSWFPNGQVSYGTGLTSRRAWSPVLKGGNNANMFTYVVPRGGCRIRLRDAEFKTQCRATILKATGTVPVYDSPLGTFSYRHTALDVGKTFRLNVYGELNELTFRFLGTLTISA